MGQREKEGLHAAQGADGRRGRFLPGCAGAVLAVLLTVAVLMATPAMAILLCLGGVGCAVSAADVCREKFSPWLAVLGMASVLVPGAVAGWILFPGWPGYVAAAVFMGVLLYGMLRLVFRFPSPVKEPSGRPVSVPYALGTGAVGFVLAPALALFMLADAPPSRFPELEEPTPQVPAGQNAYAILERAAANRCWGGDISSAIGRLECDVRAAPELWPPELRERVSEVLERWGGALDVVDEVLARPRLVTPQPAEPKGIMAGLDDRVFDHATMVGRLLSFRAQLAEQNGDYGKALADVGRLIRLSTVLCDDSANVLEYLSGCGLLVGGLACLRQVANKAPAEPVRQVVAKLPGQARLREGYESAMAGEYRSLASMVESLVALDLKTLGAEIETAPDPERLALLFRKPGLPVIKPNATMNRVGRSLQLAVRSLDRYRPEQLAAVREATKVPEGIGRWRNPLGSFCAMMPRLEAWTVEGYFEAVAQVRLTRLFVALVMYRRDNDGLPAALDELMPGYIQQIPSDPFTGEPFTYQPDAEPPRLLSAGPDQQRGRGKSSEADDLVVLLAEGVAESAAE